MLPVSYIKWLNESVSRYASFIHILTVLATFEFVPFCEDDENRLVDGVELRDLYVFDVPDGEEVGFLIPCTWAEFLVALCGRMEYLSDNDSTWWFAHILENVGLQACTDDDFEAGRVTDADIERVVNVDIPPSIGASLFPHDDSDELVSVWDAANQYVRELEGI